MLNIRNILLLASTFLIISCIRNEKDTNLPLPQETKVSLPGWAAPLPPSSHYRIKETVPTETSEILTREPVIPYWVHSKEMTAEIETKFTHPDILDKQIQKTDIISRLPVTDPYRYFSVNFDNDVFFSMDYYYTNGVGFEYFHPGMERSVLAGLTIPYRRPSVNYYGMKLVQNMYTPTRLDVTYILEGDRPFASYLYLGFTQQTYDPVRKIKLNSGLDLGMLGPTSLGGLIQTTLHNTEPTGWVNQIGNDVVLSYQAEIEKGILEKGISTLNIKGSAIAGTLYDNIKLSGILLLGRYEPYFNGSGLHCGNNAGRPKFQYAIWTEAQGTLVGYDATLQGGIFNQNNTYTLSGSELNRLTFTGKAGFFVRYRWLELKAHILLLTPEFKTGKEHKWVHFSATFCL